MSVEDEFGSEVRRDCQNCKERDDEHTEDRPTSIPDCQCSHDADHYDIASALLEKRT